LKDRLLKYYFKKFDEEKMKKQKEVADSPAQANDTQNA
jgi:hypothetical protein